MWRGVRRGSGSQCGRGSANCPWTRRLGRIAQYLAGWAAPAFGAVIAYDAFIPDEVAWLADVCRPACRGLGRAERCQPAYSAQRGTRSLIDAENLAVLPTGSYVMNVSRGALIGTSVLRCLGLPSCRRSYAGCALEEPRLRESSLHAVGDRSAEHVGS